jgi:serine/threonine protein kinase
LEVVKVKKKTFTSPIQTKLLANRYQLKQIIGKGGMGEVFLADDILLGGISVAIKFLSQTVLNHKLQEDFAREARICAALSQKSINIVRVTDYGVSEEGKPFYVMEYLRGKCLQKIIPLSLPSFMTLCRQICLGLQCAHEGINIDGKIYPLIHRDIKPANVLVLPDSILGQLVKILDFGVAKFLNSSTETTTTKNFYGTLPYCSPEQLDSDELDNRSDIYSLGVMMFEMLTGQKPFQPETNLFGAWYKAHHFESPRAIVDVNPNLQLPKKLESLIMACLAKAPSNRPQNLAEVLSVLDSLKQDIESRGALEQRRSRVCSPSPKSGLNLPVEQACKQLVWPKDKPTQEIVFPHQVNTPTGAVAALSLMMSQQQVDTYARSRRYNQFKFVLSPHPMLLWVTLLYIQALDPKWLPCYLDMQNPQNQYLVCLLAENESYPLIFFTLEAPHSCTHVIGSHIDPQQRQMLKTWVEQSRRQPSSSSAHLSKNLLKQQYKQMQVRILQRLVSKQYGVFSHNAGSVNYTPEGQLIVI